MIVHMQGRVTDYDVWRPVFDENEALRRGHGCTGHLVYRGLEDRNEVSIILQFPSALQAQSFLDDPRLREAMAKGGVIGQPSIGLYTEAGASDYAKRRAA